MFAFDGAAAFDLDAAARAGAVAVTGYIVGTPGGLPHIDKGRIDQIRAKGMGFYPNWERAIDALVHAGHSGGVDAGQEALEALRGFGVPDDGSVACAFSWDVDVAPAQFESCGVVADGILDGLGGHYRFTAYASAGLIKYLTDTGRISGVKGWLSESEGFNGFSTVDWSKYVAMVQNHDAHGNWLDSPVPDTDIDTILDAAALGAWWAPGQQFAIGEDDMTPEQDALLRRIAAAVDLDQTHPNNPSLGSVFQQITALRNDHTHANTLPGLFAAIAHLQGEVAGLSTALAQSHTGDIDLDAVKAATTQAVREALAAAGLDQPGPTS
jgi:hypothetical protein